MKAWTTRTLAVGAGTIAIHDGRMVQGAHERDDSKKDIEQIGKPTPPEP
jgi:hypothetical protein